MEPGTYIVAVSGGVDSMALLDMLHTHTHPTAEPSQLIIAHVDHGIRPDSAEDRLLVQIRAIELGLPFVYHEARLGSEAGEAQAREVRYDFLRRVQAEHGARAIITAHHQDDVLETAILNIIRGTGRKGLTALSTRPDIVRPLLNVSKAELLDYARRRQLKWREDATNHDERYARNYVRHQILNRFDQPARQALLDEIHNLQNVNHDTDVLLTRVLDTQTDQGAIERHWFNQLPHDVAREVMATWLRRHGVADFDRPMLERLVVQAKTGQPGKLYDVRSGTHLTVTDTHLALEGLER
jgi:tRNA(Ile)-lysidine synthetase-like protein